MSINTEIRSAGPFVCDGVALSFGFLFKVFNAADVVVVLTDATGQDATLMLTTDYNVSINSDQNNNPGGVVTTTAAHASGNKITITSSIPATQTVTLTNSGGFYPEVLNDALDKTIILIQQIKYDLSRTIKSPISSSETPEQLWQRIQDFAEATEQAAITASAAAEAVNAALPTLIPISQKGAASGVATLDTNGRVPTAQLPAYVDDILEYADFASLPATGQAGFIYITLNNGNAYRWSGSAYVQINASVSSADVANRLATTRSIAASGDIAWSVNFDGSSNVSAAATLANTGVSSGTYKSVTVDSKGRITGGTNPTTLAGYGINDAQPLNSELTAIGGVGSTGFLKRNGAGSWSAQTVSQEDLNNNAYKTRVYVATTEHLNATYNNGTGGVGATLENAGTLAALSVNGQSNLQTGTRLLVWRQKNRAHNGIYTVTATGSASTPWIITRATDSDTTAKLAGQVVAVERGWEYANRLFVAAWQGWMVIGTDQLVYDEVNAPEQPFKKRAFAATTGNLSAVYSNGTAGFGATLTNNSTLAQLAIDGQTLTNGRTILVKDQTIAAQNGLYDVIEQGSASTAWILRRHERADYAVNLASSVVAVDRGATQAGKLFICQLPSWASIGTDAVTFVELALKSYVDGKTWDFSAKITGKPTTLAGYGITDGQTSDSDLAAIAALSGTGYLKRNGAANWQLDTSPVAIGDWETLLNKPAASIYDYGAAGDGTTDDTSAFNAYAGYAGLKWFGAGTFNVPGNPGVRGFPDGCLYGNVSLGTDFESGFGWDTKGNCKIQISKTFATTTAHDEYTRQVEISALVDNEDAISGSTTRPVGLYVKHTQNGGSVNNNLFSHSIMSYARNNAAGDNDVVAISGRARKEHVTDGIGDAAGVWGSAYQLSTLNGGVMAGEFSIYQNAAGTTSSDRLNAKWATSIHVNSDSTGSPALAGIALDSTGESAGKYGYWNGVIIDKNVFAQNGSGAGIAGTVGVNCGSWDNSFYPEMGIKFGKATWHIYRGNNDLLMNAGKLALSNTGGGASEIGLQLNTTGTGNQYLDFLTGGVLNAHMFFDVSGNALWMGTTGADDVKLKTNGTVRATINSSGAVFLHNITTSSPGANGLYKDASGFLKIG